MERQPTLETERLVLRPLAETDREALFGIASDPAVWEQHPVWQAGAHWPYATGATSACSE